MEKFQESSKKLKLLSLAVLPGEDLQWAKLHIERMLGDDDPWVWVSIDNFKEKVDN